MEPVADSLALLSRTDTRKKSRRRPSETPLQSKRKKSSAKPRCRNWCAGLQKVARSSFMLAAVTRKTRPLSGGEDGGQGRPRAARAPRACATRGRLLGRGGEPSLGARAARGRAHGARPALGLGDEGRAPEHGLCHGRRLLSAARSPPSPAFGEDSELPWSLSRDQCGDRFHGERGVREHRPRAVCSARASNEQSLSEAVTSPRPTLNVERRTAWRPDGAGFRVWRVVSVRTLAAPGHTPRPPSLSAGTLALTSFPRQRPPGRPVRRRPRGPAQRPGGVAERGLGEGTSFCTRALSCWARSPPAVVSSLGTRKNGGVGPFWRTAALEGERPPFSKYRQPGCASIPPSWGVGWGPGRGSLDPSRHCYNFSPR